MNEEVVKNLIKTQNIIRKKYKSLKSGKIEDLSNFESVFKPIITPLNKIAETSDNNIFSAIKKSEDKTLQYNDYDDDAYNRLKNITSTPKSLTTDSRQEEEEESFSPITYNPQQLNLLYPTDQFIESLKIEQKDFDYKYGPHFNVDENAWKIGKTSFTISKNNLFLEDKVYNLSPGLIQLLFLKQPSLKECNSKDIANYLEIIKFSSALHREYDKKKQHAGNKSSKYKFIKRLLTSEQRSPAKLNITGKGLMKMNKTNTDYIFWDDPNELVDRLKILLASQQAGHTNHENEIISIYEELREANIII